MLSATSYHRWHSPVAGTIVRAFVLRGTYYSGSDSEGSNAVEPTIAAFTLTAIPQPHDRGAPLVNVRSRLPVANPTSTHD